DPAQRAYPGALRRRRAGRRVLRRAHRGRDRPPRRSGGGMNAASAYLRVRLAGLISVACDGEVSAERIAADADSPLSALGVGSLARLRLIDVIEDEFGLFVEADDIF